MDEMLKALRSLDDIALHPSSVVHAAGVRLPAPHKAILDETNGCEAYAGYLRLFGIARDDGAADLKTWNEREAWKFAWAGRADDYTCFGESGWGDQYAYDTHRLTHEGNETVYFGDALTMQWQPIADTFRDFFLGEFLRAAANPYDEATVRARKEFPLLAVDRHVTYVPSLLLGVSEAEAEIETLPAQAAMILNGDLFRQTTQAADDRLVSHLETYVDEVGRPRVRLHLV